MDKKKIFVQTQGCQMNVYDSNKMVDVLQHSHGMEATDDPSKADVVLLNTCSIREKAQEKVFSDLGRLRELKKENPHMVIGVGGCVASQEGEEILKRAPYVDMIFGPQTLHRLSAMYEEVLTNKKSVVDVSFPEIEKFDCLPEPKANGPSAYVSIMEGCSKYCSYCIVPYTRGEEISRPLDDVIAEVASLAGQNVKEIIFLGQNVNDYQGPMHEGGVADLAFLIQITAAIEGIERIRFTTSHPTAFSDSLIQAYKDIPQLVNQLHLPVQSGSNRILAMMKRGYTVEDFKTKISKIRQIRPDICISTDFIIGFPGETDQDFEETMNLIQEIGFDTSYSFIYSPRPGTPAAKLHDSIPMEVKKQRLHTLQTRILQKANEISQAMIGTHQKVLIVGPAKKNKSEISGRTENNRVVNCVGDHSLIGQIVTVEITHVKTNSLRAVLVDA